MTSALALDGGVRRAHAWRAAVWRHPEWWSLALCAAAWAAMLRPHYHHRHSGLDAWVVMTVAMMLPMVIVPIRETADRSLWRRRHRAMAAFLAGYVGCWTVVGIAAGFLPFSGTRAAAIALAAAGAWQLTPQKRIALAGCHRTIPLAPSGWRADRDCIRYGLSIGARCVASCWLLMLACALSGHALAVCAGGTAIGLVERYRGRPDHRLLSAGLFGGAALLLVLG